MSFLGNYDDARNIVMKIEKSNDVGKRGMASSNIFAGESKPGPKNKAADGTLTLKRTKARVATESLVRGDTR